ncbi:MAG: tetratricopeptide repeat protein [Flavobacteriales bacterium]|nr:tetratricopeptide repeat protein [Flavobacteriales bacterium]
MTALPRWILARPLLPVAETEGHSRIWAFAWIGAYAIASLVYGFLSDAPWDDDCVVRYFHAREAWRDPTHFFSVWNRPLFMVLFAPAALIGREAMMLQMIALSAWSGWLLYRSLQRMGYGHAHGVLPFFFFQAFYFTISRNFLTEPVAVAVTCLGLHAMVHRRWTLFAVLGGLLPLARLELAVILPIWALVLLQAKEWKRIAWMAVPLIVLMVLGYFVKDTTDPLWLVKETLGKEGKNRYGYREVWHYTQRFAYVIGPVIFFFLIIGTLERVMRRRLDLFVLGQGVAILALYIVFSSKLDMGNSAGFLRNLIPMTPFLAVLAHEGFLAWLGLPHRVALAAQAEAPAPRNDKKRTKSEAAPAKEGSTAWALGRVFLFGALALALLWFFFSKQLESHHKISKVTDRLPAMLGSALLIVGLVLAILQRKRDLPQLLTSTLAAIVPLTALAFTLWTERPDAHLNPERKAITELSTLYRKSYLREWPLYANHRWFFWPQDLGYPDAKRYRTLNKAALDTAETSSVVLWENHYSNRLHGDLQLDAMYKRSDVVELAHAVSKDRKAVVCLFQKTNGTAENAEALRERFMREHPESFHAQYALHLEELRKLRYPQALEAARAMQRIDSSNVEGYLSEGQAHFNMGNYTDAIAAFTRARKKAPRLHELDYSIALSRVRMNDYAGAVSSARAFVKRNPDSFEGHELLGTAYWYMQKLDSAVIAFDACIRIKPNAANGWLNRASCRINEQRWNMALNDLDAALQRDPTNGMAQTNRGIALIGLGRKDEGCAILRQRAAQGDATAMQRLVSCGQ